MRVDPKQVQIIAPEDWEIGRGYRLGGAVNASLTSDRGNSQTNDVYIDYRLDYRRKQGRLESHGQLEYETSRGQKLTDNWLVFNKYTHDWNTKSSTIAGHPIRPRPRIPHCSSNSCMNGKGSSRLRPSGGLPHRNSVQ
jgi:hypothetical protein